MKSGSFTNSKFETHDGNELMLYEWACKKPTAYVHIVHGMSEHSARYDDFACWLNSKNIQVFSSDLRGHGKTAGEIKKVGFFSFENGWDKVVLDLKLINDKFSNKDPLMPVFIIGHSMGSLLARSLAIQFPSIANGYLFSATSGHPGIKGVLGEPLAKTIAAIFGKKEKSNLLNFLTFGDFNKKIKNRKTNKDWLTRDNSIVNQYINDPYCMQVFSSQFFADLADGVLRVNNVERIKKMDKSKPILLLSGSMDPVGGYGKGTQSVYKKFQKAGLNCVDMKLFDEGRHEMINEINKQEVYEYIFEWLSKNIAQ